MAKSESSDLFWFHCNIVVVQPHNHGLRPAVIHPRVIYMATMYYANSVDVGSYIHVLYCRTYIHATALR